MSEELLWRGYILSRQELAHGSFVWLLNSLLSGIFIGTLTIEVTGVPAGLGSAGGLLASGLLIGYQRLVTQALMRLPMCC